MEEGDRMCLYWYEHANDENAQHFLSWCCRDDSIDRSSSCDGSIYSCNQWKENQSNLEQVLDWFAPISAIADYAQYLIDGIKIEDVFCHCSFDHHSLGTERQCEYGGTKHWMSKSISNFNDDEGEQNVHCVMRHSIERLPWISACVGVEVTIQFHEHVPLIEHGIVLIGTMNRNLAYNSLAKLVIPYLLSIAKNVSAN